MSEKLNMLRKGCGFSERFLLYSFVIAKMRMMGKDSRIMADLGRWEKELRA